MPEILLYAFAAWLIASIILAPIIGHFLSAADDLMRKPPPYHDRRNHR
jgi:hypothetical protein